MAYTLDSLEIEINSNSGGASGGVTSLTGSLTSLMGVVSSALPQLKELSNALKSIKGISGSGTKSPLGSTSLSRISKEANKAKESYDNLTASVAEAVKARGYKPINASDIPTFSSSGFEALQKASSSNPMFNSQRKTEWTGKRPSDMFNWISSRSEADDKGRTFPLYSMHGLKEEASSAQKATSAMSELKTATKAVAQANTEVKSTAKPVSEEMEKTTKHTKSLKDVLKELTKGNLLSQFGKMFKMRLMRQAIMAIIKGIKEGITNLYNWSDAINGHFASAMDTASSQFMLLKNSLATALAPAIEALIPILTTVVGWIQTACNALAQFFALLNGQSSWTKATLSVEKYGKATKGAGSATKDLLADWDELNIIQSQGGGGGGGSGATNFKDMFEEDTHFEQWLKDLVTWTKDNFDTVLGTVLAIKTALSLWKFSSMFTGTLSTLAGLASAGLTMAVTWQISYKLGEMFQKTGDEGWLIADALTGLVGSLATKSLVTKVLGTGAGTVAFGLTLAVSGAVNWIGASKEAKSNGFDREIVEQDILAMLESYIGSSVVLNYAIGGMGFVATLPIAVVLSASIIAEQIRTAPQVAPNWGTEHWDKEQIEKYVNGLFKIDVTATIEKVKVVLDENANAKAEVDKAVQDLEKDLVPFHVGAKLSEADVEQIKADVDALVEAIQGKLEAGKGVIQLEVMLHNAGETPTGTDVDLISLVGISEELISQQTKNLGEKIKQMFDEGISEGLGSVDTYKHAQEYLVALEKISNATTVGQMAGKFEMDVLEGTSGNVDKDTFQGVVDKYNEAFKTTRKSVEEATRQAYIEMRGYRESIATALELDPDNAELKQALDSWDKYLSEFNFEDRVNESMDAITRDGRKQVVDMMLGIFDINSVDIDKVMSTTETPWNTLEQLASKDMLDEPLAKQGFSDFMYGLLEDAGIQKQWVDALNLDPWELIGEEMRNKIFDAMLFGKGMTDIPTLAEMMGVSQTDLAKRWFDNFGFEFVGGADQVDFIGDMIDSLGIDEATKVFEEKGYNIGEALRDGIDNAIENGDMSLWDRFGIYADPTYRKVLTPSSASPEMPYTYGTGGDSAQTVSLLQQVVSAINSVRTELANKDTNPTVVVNGTPVGTTFARNSKLSNVQYNQVTGELF